MPEQGRRHVRKIDGAHGRSGGDGAEGDGANRLRRFLKGAEAVVIGGRRTCEVAQAALELSRYRVRRRGSAAVAHLVVQVA